ncbi:unnamed protein product [Protopolystoma xenopodis]|uniref:Uncharacterized protein n=1 Tax=Protopolystoma xenopodis TaxID=117903 RepID=A0A448WTB6_9PLAT|nr:unnamed protein product [Protopolystoma xenopodis]
MSVAAAMRLQEHATVAAATVVAMDDAPLYHQHHYQAQVSNSPGSGGIKQKRQLSKSQSGAEAPNSPVPSTEIAPVGSSSITFKTLA